MMNESRFWYFVGFIVFTYFGLKFFESAFVNKQVAEHGVERIVRVASFPNCGRSSNSLEVEFNLKTYTIEISKDDCIHGRYKIGDMILVKYSPVFDKMLLLGDKTNLAYWMSILFFLLPLYCLVQTIPPLTNILNKRKRKRS